MKITFIILIILSLNLLAFARDGRKHNRRSRGKGRGRNKMSGNLGMMRAVNQMMNAQNSGMMQAQNTMMNAQNSGMMQAQNAMMNAQNAEMMQAQNAMMSAENEAETEATEQTQASRSITERLPAPGVDNVWESVMADMMHDMQKVRDSYNDPDIDFATMMIPHHWGAIFMCEEFMKMLKSDVLSHICDDIQWTQMDDINKMINFLHEQGVNYIDPSLNPTVDYVVEWDGEVYNPAQYMSQGKVPLWQTVGGFISEGKSRQAYEAWRNSQQNLANQNTNSRKERSRSRG